MGPYQIVVASHLFETIYGTAKLRGQFAVTIKGSRGRFCRDNQLHIPIIEFIHQINEAPDLVIIGIIHGRNIGNHHGVIATGNFNVIRDTPWPPQS